MVKGHILVTTCFQIVITLFIYGYIEKNHHCGYVISICLASGQYINTDHKIGMIIAVLQTILYFTVSPYLSHIVFVLLDVYLSLYGFPKDDNEMIVKFRPFEKEVRHYLFRNDPTILHRVDDMLNEFEGREDVLISELKNKESKHLLSNTVNICHSSLLAPAIPPNSSTRHILNGILNTESNPTNGDSPCEVTSSQPYSSITESGCASSNNFSINLGARSSTFSDTLSCKHNSASDSITTAPNEHSRVFGLQFGFSSANAAFNESFEITTNCRTETLRRPLPSRDFGEVSGFTNTITTSSTQHIPYDRIDFSSSLNGNIEKTDQYGIMPSKKKPLYSPHHFTVGGYTKEQPLPHLAYRTEDYRRKTISPYRRSTNYLENGSFDDSGSKRGESRALVEYSRSQLVNIFQKFSPHLVRRVDLMLSEYRGREAELLVDIMREYDISS